MDENTENINIDALSEEWSIDWLKNSVENSLEIMKELIQIYPEVGEWKYWATFENAAQYVLISHNENNTDALLMATGIFRMVIDFVKGRSWYYDVYDWVPAVFPEIDRFVDLVYYATREIERKVYEIS